MNTCWDIQQTLVFFSVCAGVAIGLSQGIAYVIVQWYEARSERMGKFDGPEEP
jgi:hypothetical protein